MRLDEKRRREAGSLNVGHVLMGADSDWPSRSLASKNEGHDAKHHTSHIPLNYSLTKHETHAWLVMTCPILIDLATQGGRLQ